ncbi:transcriptional regulator, AraC family [Catenulispora acidiphila DSM 44928]|uniref:Transcriptional regulator, AraC family n=1 Tax=Catenulispora acidiphila (strain DSM 44928 / JCM 14897 / NBRC 102108 / NRRL B-24433 / ID139908) TaxID=479433 RepID=C7PWF9_CATAD|nr:AraC family transcriptional regulator [Catenulispora acidiphila]ACU75239.1 transcriptional regulator, AraC family [Catenulispora acidiphila DSM 44928]
MNEAVERVVAYLYDQYDQPITLADMADVAILSQFHFARTFREVTGVSPGRFLSAIRLQRAKTLLTTTELTVTDISYMVGYNSLGTFTSRFTKSVGVTPIQYRSFAQADLAAGLGGAGRPGEDPAAFGAMAGWMTLPPAAEVRLMYIGVFDGPILQHLPVSCTMVENETAFQLDSVPEGEWYVFAAAVNPDEPPVDEYGSRVARLVAREGPVKCVRGQTTMLDLAMRPCRPTDPPMLLALPVVLDCSRVRQPMATSA